MDKVQRITQTVLKAVALGMSVASLVLGYLGTIETVYLPWLLLLCRTATSKRRKKCLHNIEN